MKVSTTIFAESMEISLIKEMDAPFKHQ